MDKYWISSGGVLHHVRDNHQDWARRWLRRERRRFKDGWRAQSVLLDRGWTRVQLYDHGGLGLHGIRGAVGRRGPAVLRVIPRPRRVYLLYHPTLAGEILQGRNFRGRRGV
ncbi:MAG: hypothetical protein HY553_10905 [Elusimicrobia bacterium]|nr:hypothetical protein [Elusimicrobiota bacterium]